MTKRHQTHVGLQPTYSSRIANAHLGKTQDLMDLQRFEWQDQIETIVAETKPFSGYRPLDRPGRYERDYLTFGLRFRFTKEERAPAPARHQNDVQVRKKLRESRCYAPEPELPDSAAGGAIHFMANFVKTPHKLTPPEYLRKMHEVAQALQGQILSPNADRFGRVMNGRYRFPDGSEIWFREDGSILY